jgi:DNA-binding IclR family transcriptional regulator
MLEQAESTTPPERRAEATASGLQVLDRAFAVLGLFTCEEWEWTTTGVARAAGLTVPTAHRILRTLRAHGFVARDDETKRFRLGPASLALGDRARAVIDIRFLARPVLQQLVMETGETALLTGLNEDRDRSVCLERVESTQPLRLSVQPGRQLPLHAGASQTVILAYMPDEEIARLLEEPLERLCSGTITNPATARANLDEIRARGYAQSIEETNEGAFGIAVPILDSDRSIIAGVGLAGPSARLSQKRLSMDLRHLHKAAGDIGRALGVPVMRERGAARG